MGPTMNLLLKNLGNLHYSLSFKSISVVGIEYWICLYRFDIDLWEYRVKL